jgi:hypothetical protein
MEEIVTARTLTVHQTAFACATFRNRGSRSGNSTILLLPVNSGGAETRAVSLSLARAVRFAKESSLDCDRIMRPRIGKIAKIPSALEVLRMDVQRPTAFTNVCRRCAICDFLRNAR